ncbi:MAG: tetratricopeptide repeat protein [Leptospirales bacterium]
MRAKWFTIANFRMTVILPFLMLGIVASCSKNPAELQKKFMSQGQHYLSEGKTNEAVIEFQNLLKVNPHSSRGHYWLGKAYMAKGWNTESVIEFQNASKEDPLFLGPHLELARYGVNSGQWNATKPEILAILKIDPNNADGWTFSGQRAMALGHEKEAQKDLDHALSLKPGSVIALVAMGDLKRHQNHPKQAKSLYQKSLGQDPNESRAWTGMGYVAQSLGQTNEALTDFRKAVQVNPTDLRSQIILANFMAQQGHLHKAIGRLKAIPAKSADLRIPVKIAEYETLLGENIQAIRLLHPLERQKIQIPDIYFVLAKAYEQTGRKKDALDMVDRLMQMVGVPPIMKVGASRIALTAGNSEEAQKILSSIKDVSHLPDSYWVTKGQVELALNHPAKANRTFNEGLKLFPDNPTLLQNLADVQAVQKNYKGAIRILSGLLKKNPRDIGAISRMGALLAQTSGPGREIRYYQHSAQENPNNPALEVLYLLSLATNRKLPAAIHEAGIYLGSHPDNQNIRFLLAQFYLQTGHKNRASQTYKAILNKDPKYFQALVSLAGQELDNGHYAEAESLYRRAILISPENANLYAALGGTLLAENQRDAAVKAFQKSLSYNPDQPFALLSVAKTEILSGNSHQALTHLTPLMKASFPPRRKAEIQWLWGLAAEKNGDMKNALNALEKAVALEPRNADYHASLGDFWASLSQWNKSLPEYDKSLKLHPDNPLLALKKNWVTIQASKRKPDPAFVNKVISQALDYRKSHPDNPPAALIAAQGNLIIGKPEPALVLYNNVLSKNPDNQTALIGKSSILLAQGHGKQARKLVEQLLTIYPDNVQANLMMASIDEKEHKIQAEADHLEKVHQILPDWVQPALALSAADLSLQRFEEAKSVSFSLHESHPELDAALYFLASAEMGLKEYRNALKDFSTLAQKSKHPGPIYSLMSVAAIHIGDRTREKKYLYLALKDSPNDPTALNNMAYYLANDKHDLAKALVYARKAVKLSSQPNIQDTMGYILFMMGNYTGAEPHFRMAYKARFRDPEFLYHMGMNEWKLGKNNPASELLRKSIVSGSLSPQELELARKTLKKLSTGT